MAVLGLCCSTWTFSSWWCEGSPVADHGLSCPKTCRILVPWPGIEPVSSALEGRFLITGPLGKSLQRGFWENAFSSVQSLSRVRLFATPWITARQASLFIINSRSLLRLMSIESVMPFSHLILYHPLLLLPPILPSIKSLFQWVSSSHEVAKVLEFQLQDQSFQWTPRTDLL